MCTFPLLTPKPLHLQAKKRIAPHKFTRSISAILLFSLLLFGQASYGQHPIGFQRQQKFSASAGTIAPVIADIDGDGKKDIIVAHWFANSISVFRNSSVSGSMDASSFPTKVELATEPWAIALAVADFDGDDRADIAVVNAGSPSTLSFFRNLSSPGTLSTSSFAIKKAYVSNYSGYRDLTLGDFDNDGKIDIALVSANDNRLLVYGNQSMPDNINFHLILDLPTSVSPYSITASDLNGDGKIDLAIANKGGNSLSVSLNETSNQGQLGFAEPVTLASADGQPHAVIAADLDGDGKPDLALLNQAKNNVAIYRNQTTMGSFGPESFAPPIFYTVGPMPTGLEAGDIDGDGKLDLMTTNLESNNISVLRNISSGSGQAAISFQSRSDFATGAQPWGLASADIDGDGKTDLVVANYSDAAADNSFSVLRNAEVPLTTNATHIIATNILGSQATLSWADGNGSKRLVFLAPAGTPVVQPLNGQTYEASPIFQNGSQLGATAWYCVYKGTGSSVNLSGLNKTTAYQAMVIEYNGIAGSEQYLQLDLPGNGNPQDFSTTSDNATLSGLSLSPVFTLSPAFNANVTEYLVNVPANRELIGIRASTAQASATITINSAPTASGTLLQNIPLNPGPNTIPIVVTTPDGTTNTYTLTIARDFPPPTITDFSPKQGQVGTTVTITGANFSGDITGNAVFFGATRATVSSANSTSLTVTVPTGASRNSISITNLTNRTTAESTQPFILRPVQGTLAFRVPEYFSANSQLRRLLTTDIDGDGKVDIIAINASTVSIYRNSSPSDSPTAADLSERTDIAIANINTATIGDLNGDGKPDLVLGHSSGNILTILYNLSVSGTIDQNSFNITQTQPYLSSTPIYQVVISDLNGDGRPDLIASTGNYIRIYRHSLDTQGSPVFQHQTSLELSITGPVADLQVGDLNNDGKPDILALGQGRLNQYRNTSQNLGYSFQHTIRAMPNLASMAIGDLDGDGRLDIILGLRNFMRLEFYKNTSTTNALTFSGSVIFNIPSSAVTVQTVDMDGDGKLDVVASYSNTTVSILKNNFVSGQTANSSSLSQWKNFPSGASIASDQVTDIADMDGDGRFDIIINVQSNTNPRIAIIRGITVPTISSILPISGPIGTAITIQGTNFNLQGSDNHVYFGAVKARVTSATSSGIEVTLPEGASFGNISMTDIRGGNTAVSNQLFTPTYANGLIQYRTQQKFATGNRPIAPILADIDGDGKPDMIVANFLENSISIYRNTSTSGSMDAGSFGPKIDFVTNSQPVHISLGDLNGDGRPDLVVANAASGNSLSYVSVYLNQSSPGSIDATSLKQKMDIALASGSSGPRSTAIADFDGDGLSDIAVACAGSNSIVLLRNLSSNPNNLAFNSSLTFPTGAAPFSMLAQDFDGDGKIDLAVANRDTNTVSLYRNLSVNGGHIAFSAATAFTTGNRPHAITAGDYDGDGKIDLAVANLDDHSVSIFRNTLSAGTIDATSFAPKVDLNVGSNPNDIRTADLDGDGRPDLATSNYGSNSVSVLRNNFSGTLDASAFEAKKDFTTGDTPWGLALGDIDGDGRPDIVAANYADLNNENTLSVLLNGALAPTLQATELNFSGTTTSQTTLAWTKGNGSKRAVFMAIADNGQPSPVQGNTYTANNTFGNGGQIGSSGWYCIYNGTGNSVLVSGLSAGSTYRAMVMEYNDIPGHEQYLNSTGTNNPANVTTISTDASLSGLSLSSGTLSPDFDKAVTSYTANVANSTTTVRLSATTSASGASLKVNGAPLESGDSSDPIALNVGENQINIEVTAQDGSTMRTYTITLTRSGSTNADLASLSLSQGVLSPNFTAATTGYTASVAHSVSQISLTVATAQANASVKVNGLTVGSGNSSEPIDLNVGENQISIEVTAQHGNQKTYNLTVTRAASGDASLASLLLSSGVLSPGFSPQTTSYRATVGAATNSISIIPTTTHAAATIMVNGQGVVSGESSNHINLRTGENVITILVRAQDATTRTYTLTIDREGVLPVNLENYKVKTEPNGVRISWATHGQQRHSHFTIERSADGREFQPIYRTDTKGAANGQQQYEHLDKLPLPGTSYYRLLQTDMDGTTTDLGIRPVNYAASAAKFSFYPNPTRDQLNLSFPSGQRSLTVSDLSGRILRKQVLSPAQTTASIELSDLPAATYLISLSGTNGTVHHKVVKL